ncbi:MAG: methylenetetrahydrofolate reductase [NAD(P)H] [Defluviitaleaceae bacterium]|nr:methylenetetrahydrofolate reductase [NAD(P)H] [Defluviitaleaceae bacterium]
MKISDILKSREITISCELFPPKPGGVLEKVAGVVADIAALSPSFMSVTYGAGGAGSHNTADIANEIQNKNGIVALAHLTCVGSKRAEIVQTLEELSNIGIKNILALRGDYPPGAEQVSGDFRYASDLVHQIHAVGDFCVGGACYPEGHPESASLQKDVEALKIKVEAGCSFLTTQMFFDNNVLYSFMYRLLKNGIHVPVVAGVMPVTNAKQVARICDISKTALPPRFKAMVDRFAAKPRAMKQAGIAYATEQIIDLIANGVNHIHLYTMNKPDIAGGIMANLSEIFG